MELNKWEQLKQDEDFQRGVRMFREKKVPKPIRDFLIVQRC